MGSMLSRTKSRKQNDYITFSEQQKKQELDGVPFSICLQSKEEKRCKVGKRRAREKVAMRAL